jgi:phosphatidylglycerol:prolipoprotein diacylglycerol transferase
VTFYPLIIRLGPLEITGYGIMMMVGFLVGGWLIGRELRRLGLNENYSQDIVVAAVIGGVVGAKLWYVALTGDGLFDRGGLVWYGGFLGGAAAVMLTGHWRKVPPSWTAHLAAPALAAAYALGRIGCFLVNDDYGHPSDVAWAVRFPQGYPPSTAGNLRDLFGIPIPEGMDPGTVLAVHPTQLYETALMLLAFGVLWRLRRGREGTGWLFGLYLVLAGVERFAIEFLRAKDDRFLGPLTLAQATSIALVILGAAILSTTAHRKAPDPGPFLKASGTAQA